MLAIKIVLLGFEIKDIEKSWNFISRFFFLPKLRKKWTNPNITVFGFRRLYIKEENCSFEVKIFHQIFVCSGVNCLTSSLETLKSKISLAMVNILKNALEVMNTWKCVMFLFFFFFEFIGKLFKNLINITVLQLSVRYCVKSVQIQRFF